MVWRTENLMNDEISQSELAENSLRRLSRVGEKRRMDSVLPSVAQSHAVVYTNGISKPSMVTHVISVHLVPKNLQLGTC